MNPSLPLDLSLHAPDLFKELVEQISLGVAVLQGQALCYENACLRAMTGRDPNLPLNLSLQEIIAPENWEDFTAILEDWETQGPLKAETESQLQTRQGGRTQVHVQFNPLTGKSGQLLALTFRNITRYKLAEQQKEEFYRQLQINLEYFDNLFERMPLGAWVFDLLALDESEQERDDFTGLQHRKLGFCVSIQRINLALENLLGYSREELRGKSVLDSRLVGEEAARIFFQELQARRSGKRGSYEINLSHKNGKLIPVALEAIPLLFNPQTGEAQQVIALIMDLSERKKWEEELFRLNRQLQVLSQTDALTNLANRRSFDEYLVAEWEKAGRENTPLSLIMLDIDDFKAYNDHYGHMQGDEALKAVAAQVAAVFRRKKDLAARYGGEEFVVIAPNTPKEEAFRLAEELGHKIRQLNLPHEKARAAKVVTVSLGVAGMRPGEVIAWQSLLAKADQALYQAKEKGRDRACLAV